jgi:hypothetical protein
MTYLELVNAVLRRLRENEVTTVQGGIRQNTYARLIGDFINESKAQCESAWDWSALRTTLTVTTTPDIFNYILTGSNNKFEILNVLNDSSDTVMKYQTSKWFDSQFLLTDPQKGSPYYYSFNGVDAVGDTQVDVWPIPDSVEELRFNVVLRPMSLVTDTDKLIIPSRPVILLATAMAIEERGEDGAQQSVNAYATGQSALSDEIALDAARHPEELIWHQV